MTRTASCRRFRSRERTRHELGGTYVISADTDSADSLKKIAKIQAKVTYDDVAHLETKSADLLSGHYYDDYGVEITDPAKQTEEYFNGVSATVSISSAHLNLGKNFSGTVRNKMYDQTTRTFTVEADRAENLQDGDNNLFTFELPIPHTVDQSVVVPANVTITYTTTDGKDYTVTTGLKDIPIYAYYTLDPGIQVAGAQNGTLQVSTADGKPADVSVLSIYIDGSGKSGGRIPVRASENLPDMIAKCNLPIVSHCRKIEIDRRVGKYLFFNGSQQGIQLLRGFHGRIFRTVSNHLLFFNCKPGFQRNRIAVLHRQLPENIIASGISHKMKIRNIGCIRKVLVVNRFHVFELL